MTCVEHSSECIGLRKADLLNRGQDCASVKKTVAIWPWAGWLCLLRDITPPSDVGIKISVPPSRA